jgi:uncharacterized protein
LNEGQNEFTVKESPEELGLDQKDYKIKGKVNAEVSVNNFVHRLEVNGNVKADVLLECSRCLKEFVYKINANYDLIYSRGIELKQGEIKKEEFDEFALVGDCLDLSEDIRQTVLLEIPLKPVCKETCKGIESKGNKIQIEEEGSGKIMPFSNLKERVFKKHGKS